MKRNLTLLTLIALVLCTMAAQATTITVRIQNGHTNLVIFESRESNGQPEIWVEDENYNQIGYAMVEFGPIYDQDGNLQVANPQPDQDPLYYGWYTEITIDIGSYSASDIEYVNFNWYYTSDPFDYGEMQWQTGSSDSPSGTPSSTLRVSTDGVGYIYESITADWLP